MKKKKQEKIRPQVISVKASSSTKGRGGGAIMEGRYFIYRGNW